MSKPPIVAKEIQISHNDTIFTIQVTLVEESTQVPPINIGSLPSGLSKQWKHLYLPYFGFFVYWSTDNGASFESPKKIGNNGSNVQLAATNQNLL